MASYPVLAWLSVTLVVLVICGVLAVTAGLTVIPAFGLMGATWARAVIQVAAVAMGGGFVFWKLRFPLPLFDLARLLLAAAICGAVARGVLTVSSSSLSLLPAIAGGVISYVAAVRLLRALHPEDAERLRTLCAAFPVRLRAMIAQAIDLLAPEPRPAPRSPGAFAAARSHRSSGDAD